MAVIMLACTRMTFVSVSFTLQIFNGFDIFQAHFEYFYQAKKIAKKLDSLAIFSCGFSFPYTCNYINFLTCDMQYILCTDGQVDVQQTNFPLTCVERALFTTAKASLSHILTGVLKAPDNTHSNTDRPAQSDTLGNGRKCHYKRDRHSMRHFLVQGYSFRTQKVSLQLYCVNVTGVTVSGEPCNHLRDLVTLLSI